MLVRWSLPAHTSARTCGNTNGGDRCSCRHIFSPACTHSSRAAILTLTIDSNGKPASLRLPVLLPSAHPRPDRCAIYSCPAQIYRRDFSRVRDVLERIRIENDEV